MTTKFLHLLWSWPGAGWTSIGPLGQRTPAQVRFRGFDPELMEVLVHMIFAIWVVIPENWILSFTLQV